MGNQLTVCLHWCLWPWRAHCHGRPGAETHQAAGALPCLGTHTQINMCMCIFDIVTHTCIFIFKQICVHFKIYIHMYTYMCVSVTTYIYIWIHIYIYIFIYRHLCLYFKTFVWTYCMYMNLIFFLQTYQFIWWVYMCDAHMHINANMNTYIFLNVYLYWSTFVFVFQNICMNILYGHEFDILSYTHINAFGRCTCVTHTCT